jgi:hypothetical protein
MLPLKPQVVALPRFGPPEFCETEQRSDEWREMRRGIPTASRFADVLAGGAGLTRMTYLHELAGELFTGEIAENFRSPEMDRGIAMEADALSWYGRSRLARLTPVGFVRRKLPSGRYVGGSPDALVDDDGVVEVKTSAPKRIIAILNSGERGYWAEHRAQCQGLLWLSGRKWCDLVLYYRGKERPLVPLPWRFERDERFIKELSDAVEVFDYDLNKAFERALAATSKH